MVSETFASVLRSGRAEFNSRFAEARRPHPNLDGAAFSGFLETTVDKLVRAAEPLGADRVADMVLAAYDAGLAACRTYPNTLFTEFLNAGEGLGVK